MAAALTVPFEVAAAVLAVAGIAKLRVPEGAARALSALGLPAWRWVVRAFACGELAVAAACLTHPTRLAAAALAALYSVFAVLALALRRRRSTCGCFGVDEAPASAAQALLSGACAAVSAAAAASVPHPLGWVLGRPPGSALLLVVGLGACVYGAVLAYTELPRAWASWGGR